MIDLTIVHKDINNCFITQQMEKFVSIMQQSVIFGWRYVARDRAIVKYIARCFCITPKHVRHIQSDSIQLFYAFVGNIPIYSPEVLSTT